MDYNNTIYASLSTIPLIVALCAVALAISVILRCLMLV